MEALKSHRRISIQRPMLDPDLPGILTEQVYARDDYSNANNSTSTSPSSSSGGTPLSRGWSPTSGVSLSDNSSSSSSFTGTLARRNGSANARSTFTARRRGLNGPTIDNEQAKKAALDPGSESSDIANGNNVPLAKPLDPSHLFWVPASVHPEISPSDFRKFLHDHASRAVREQEDSNEITTGSSSSQISPVSPTGTISPLPVETLKQRSTSVARRGSTLRRQYRPEMDTESGLSSSVQVRRASSKIQRPSNGTAAPQLSISDLQKLERLAEEASNSSDPSELRSVLRRTMSLSIAPSALDQVDALPAESEQDAPLIVPRPGQILRRAARTKIRKSSFSTDGLSRESGGGGGSGRRRRLATGSGNAGDTTKQAEYSPAEKRASDLSEPSDESSGLNIDTNVSYIAAGTDSTLEPHSRDSYASEDTQRTSLTSLADSVESGTSSARAHVNDGLTDVPHTPTQGSVSAKNISTSPLEYKESYFETSERASTGFESDQDVPSAATAKINNYDKISKEGHTAAQDVQNIESLHAFERTRPAPQPPVQPRIVEAATNKDSATPPGVPLRVTRSDTMPNLVTTPTPPAKSGKEKKGGFGQWLSSWTKDEESNEKLSKKEKKERKEKERDPIQHSQQQHSSGGEREKDSSSFLGSLFGKRKTHEDPSRFDYSINTHSAASVMAGSLLDAHGKMAGDWTYYDRYPIHIERAVYRLSHIKLANPRRPLYEQVLISNLMFWYLSVINQTQQQQQQQAQQQQQQKRHQHQLLLQQQKQQAADSQSGSSGPDTADDADPDFNHTRLYNSATDTMQPLLSHAPLVDDQMEVHHPMRPELHDGQMIGTASAGSSVQPLYTEDGPERSPDTGDADRSDRTSAFGDRESSANGRQRVPTNTAAATISRGGSPPLQKSRKSGLVKPNRAPPGTRSAERAIPAAAYGAQYRQLNSEMAHAHSVEPQSERNRVSPSMTSVRLVGRDATPSNTNSADEHAWLGSQKRSPNADDRRVDPLNDTSTARALREAEGMRKGTNKFSGPSKELSDANANSADEVDAYADKQANGTISDIDGWTRQAVAERAASAMKGDSDGFLIAGSKEASAMLDAARQSRSRRR